VPPPLVHEIVTVCAPADGKVTLSVGAIAPSLRSHLYVTTPGPLAIMIAEKLTVLGQGPIYVARSTLIVIPVI